MQDTQLFAGTGSGQSVQKQLLFLVLAGLKPAATAISSRTIRTASGIEIQPDHPKLVGAFLEELGVAYRMKVTRYGTEVFVSLDPKLANELFNTRDEYQFGLRVGFPKSAVVAWRSGSLLSHDDERELYAHEGVTGKTDFFRLSQTHAMEEFTVLKGWWAALDEYGLG